MKFNYFVPNNYQEFVDTCIQCFKSGEQGIYLFFPKTDRERRIEQIIQDHQTDFKMDILYLTSQIVNEIEDVSYFIKHKYPKGKHKRIGIFVVRCEIAVMEQSTGFLDELTALSTQDPTYQFIFISEIDLTHLTIAKNFYKTKVFNNVHYYPLYDKNDSYRFLQNLCLEWKFAADENKKAKIVELCGGHFWLLKEALRVTMKDAKARVEDICLRPAIQLRLEQIYFALLDSERIVLKKIIVGEHIGESADERHSYNYLKQIRLIQDNKITIPLLESYMKSHLPKMNLALSENHITVNNVIIDTHFSRKEIKAIRVLMQSLNKIVSRDIVAKAIWPIDTESFYSDWAIDRIMSRVREKLEKMGIRKDTIKTLRGKGYMITSE